MMSSTSVEKLDDAGFGEWRPCRAPAVLPVRYLDVDDEKVIFGDAESKVLGILTCADRQGLIMIGRC